MLKEYGVDTIVDIRSTPYSKYASQYNKEALSSYLKTCNITYIYMGNHLGAKYDDRNLLFQNSKVNFSKVQNTSNFTQGIDRVKSGLEQGYTIALMCAEKEPFECHRFGLISEYISREDIEVKHILEVGTVSQYELEEKLLNKYSKELPKTDIFSSVSKEEQLSFAYRLHNKSIAYTSKH